MTDVEKRALSEGVDSAGGFLTPEILASRLIDRVRNAGKVFAAGATTVPLESDTVAFARLVSGTGFALSADGLWRSHSWLLDTSGRLVETTEMRTGYYGYEFADAEGAELFASAFAPS